MSDGELDGVRVLDLTRLLPGPYASQLMADQGADVIKVEEPDLGDYARYMEPHVDGVGALFSTFNRGKRSITLDLSTDRGRELLHRLAENADVVMEGFSPGTVDSLGVGPGDLREQNGDLIYCSISGYGQDGPYADRPGHDLAYAGYVGLLDMTRSGPGDPPAIPGVPVTDMAAGLQAAYRVVTALLSRELGNDYDAHLDVSMAESALSLMQVVNAEAMAGQNPRPGETPLTGKYPCYGIYPTSDDRYVTLSALEPKFWSAFCDAVGRPELEELHLSEEEGERERLAEGLTELFRSRSLEEWEDELGDEDVMVGSVLKPNEAVENEHFLARGVLDVEECRVNLSGDTSDTAGGWPDLGEHNAEVLGILGVTPSEVQDLAEAGVV